MDSDESGFGFGGAPLRSLSSFTPQTRPSVAIYGVDRDLSRRYGGVNDGAAMQIRQRTARMSPWVRGAAERGYCPVDIGILSGENRQTIAEDVVRLAATLAKLSIRPVAIGCDHTVSYMQLLGLSATVRPTYIYFDAHLDLGLHSEAQTGLDNGNFVHALLTKGIVGRVINIGARSWTTWAPENKVDGLTVIRMNKAGDRAELVALLQEIDGPVYVSIDGDVLDPVWAPDCCCPEPMGMAPLDLLNMCSTIAGTQQIIGVDVSEISGGSGGTSEILLRCVHALFDQFDQGNR